MSVVWKMPDDFSLLKGLKFNPDENDRELERWQNGARGSVRHERRVDLDTEEIKPRPADARPVHLRDARASSRVSTLASRRDATADTKHLTWLILKAHTKNRRGTVRLKDADPRTPPEINFRYFSEGTDVEQDDLQALVEGIKFVRQFSCCKPSGATEVLPGGDYTTDDELRAFVAEGGLGPPRVVQLSDRTGWRSDGGA